MRCVQVRTDSYQDLDSVPPVTLLINLASVAAAIIVICSKREVDTCNLGTQLLCIYLNKSKYVLSIEVVAFLRRRGSVCWAATELSPRPLLLWRRRRKIVPVNKDQEMINTVKQ